MILRNREEIARVEVCERFFGLNNWPVPLRRTVRPDPIRWQRFRPDTVNGQESEERQNEMRLIDVIP